MVNSESLDVDVDRNEKAEFTPPKSCSESPRSLICINAGNVSLCENGFTTQTADSLPVSKAIEPTATETDYKCNNMPEISKCSGEPDHNGRQSQLPEKNIKSGVFCSVPLERLGDVLLLKNSFKDMCLYCDRHFVAAGLKQKHVERCHSIKYNRRLSARRTVQKSLKCMFCNNLNDIDCNLRTLFEHLVSIHSSEYFGCLHCEVRFQNLHLLEKHMIKIHGRIKPIETIQEQTDVKSLHNSSPTILAPILCTDNNYKYGNNKNKKIAVLSKKAGIRRCLPTRQTSKLYKKNNSLNTISVSNPFSSKLTKIKKASKYSNDNTVTNKLTFDVFDKTFFSKVKSNIQENLLYHLDGKLFKTRESENRISSFQKTVQHLEEINQTSSQSPETRISSLAISEFDYFDTQLNSGHKPTLNNEVHYKYFTRRKYQEIISQNHKERDLSKLDLSTQMAVKIRQQNFLRLKQTDTEKTDYTNSDEYKQTLQVDELNKILDKRGPLEDLKEEAIRKVEEEKLSSGSFTEANYESFVNVSAVLDDIVNSVFSITRDDIISCNTKPELPEDTAQFLNLIRVNRPVTDHKIATNNDIVELTGEWARSRIYICAVCGAKKSTAKLLVEHKNFFHENVVCQHYEFVGSQGELYRHLSIPSLGKVGSLEDETDSVDLFKKSDARICSKCNKQFNCVGDLHRHVLECGEDWSWLLQRKRHKNRPHGARHRKKKRLLIYLQGLRNRKKEESAGEKRKYKKKVNGPRTKPSDAETIQRMLANLPAKRVRKITPISKDNIKKSSKNQNKLPTKTANKNLVVQKKTVIRNTILVKNVANRARRRLRSNSSNLIDTKNSIIKSTRHKPQDKISTKIKPILRRHSLRRLEKGVDNTSWNSVKNTKPNVKTRRNSERIGSTVTESFTKQKLNKSDTDLITLKKEADSNNTKLKKSPKILITSKKKEPTPLKNLKSDSLVQLKKNKAGNKFQLKTKKKNIITKIVQVDGSSQNMATRNKSDDEKIISTMQKESISVSQENGSYNEVDKMCENDGESALENPNVENAVELNRSGELKVSIIKGKIKKQRGLNDCIAMLANKLQMNNSFLENNSIFNLTFSDDNMNPNKHILSDNLVLQNHVGQKFGKDTEKHITISQRGQDYTKSKKKKMPQRRKSKTRKFDCDELTQNSVVAPVDITLVNGDDLTIDNYLKVGTDVVSDAMLENIVALESSLNISIPIEENFKEQSDIANTKRKKCRKLSFIELNSGSILSNTKQKFELKHIPDSVLSNKENSINPKCNTNSRDFSENTEPPNEIVAELEHNLQIKDFPKFEEKGQDQLHTDVVTNYESIANTSISTELTSEETLQIAATTKMVTTVNGITKKDETPKKNKTKNVGVLSQKKMTFGNKHKVRDKKHSKEKTIHNNEIAQISKSSKLDEDLQENSFQTKGLIDNMENIALIDSDVTNLGIDNHEKISSYEVNEHVTNILPLNYERQFQNMTNTDKSVETPSKSKLKKIHKKVKNKHLYLDNWHEQNGDASILTTDELSNSGKENISANKKIRRKKLHKLIKGSTDIFSKSNIDEAVVKEIELKCDFDSEDELPLAQFFKRVEDPFYKYLLTIDEVIKQSVEMTKSDILCNCLIGRFKTATENLETGDNWPLGFNQCNAVNCIQVPQIEEIKQKHMLEIKKFKRRKPKLHKVYGHLALQKLLEPPTLNFISNTPLNQKSILEFKSSSKRGKKKKLQEEITVFPQFSINNFTTAVEEIGLDSKQTIKRRGKNRKSSVIESSPAVIDNNNSAAQGQQLEVSLVQIKKRRRKKRTLGDVVSLQMNKNLEMQPLQLKKPRGRKKVLNNSSNNILISQITNQSEGSELVCPGTTSLGVLIAETSPNVSYTISNVEPIDLVHPNLDQSFNSSEWFKDRSYALTEKKLPASEEQNQPLLHHKVLSLDSQQSEPKTTLNENSKTSTDLHQIRKPKRKKRISKTFEVALSNELTLTKKGIFEQKGNCKEPVKKRVRKAKKLSLSLFQSSPELQTMETNVLDSNIGFTQVKRRRRRKKVVSEPIFTLETVALSPKLLDTNLEIKDSAHHQSVTQVKRQIQGRCAESYDYNITKEDFVFNNEFSLVNHNIRGTMDSADHLTPNEEKYHKNEIEVNDLPVVLNGGLACILDKSNINFTLDTTSNITPTKKQKRKKESLVDESFEEDLPLSLLHKKFSPTYISQVEVEHQNGETKQLEVRQNIFLGNSTTEKCMRDDVTDNHNTATNSFKCEKEILSADNISLEASLRETLQRRLSNTNLSNEVVLTHKDFPSSSLQDMEVNNVDDSTESTTTSSFSGALQLSPVKSKKGRGKKRKAFKFTRKAPQTVVSNATIICDICNKTFSRPENFLKHKRTLTHIAKLSALEALQRTTKEIDTSSDFSMPTLEPLTEGSDICLKKVDGVENAISSASSPKHSIQLVDIISEVLIKPADNLMSIPSRCKSLGERKSFESFSNGDDFMTDTSADIIVEKQISLLENMIEDNRINFHCSPVNDYASAFGSPNQDISFTHNTNIISNLIKPILDDNLLKASQYEEISDDSNSSHLQCEEQNSRKALNRDEELFLECCSLLKSSSDNVSDVCKKPPKTSMPFLNSFELRPIDECDWLEHKQLHPAGNNFHSANTRNLKMPININKLLGKNDTPYFQQPIFEDISTDGEASLNSNNSFDDLSDGYTNDKYLEERSLNVHSPISPNIECAVIPEEYIKLHETIENDLEKTAEKRTPPLSECLQPHKMLPTGDVISPPTFSSTLKTNYPYKEESKKFLTKGALKVFEGVRISIPKASLDMDKILYCNSNSKQLEKVISSTDNLSELEGSVYKPEKKTTTKLMHLSNLFNIAQPVVSVTNPSLTVKSQVAELVATSNEKLVEENLITTEKHIKKCLKDDTTIPKNNKIIKNKSDKLNLKKTLLNSFGNKLGLKVTKRRAMKQPPKINIIKKSFDVYDFEETQDNMDVIIAEDSVPVYQRFTNKITQPKKPSKKLNTNKNITKKKCMIMERIFKNALKPKHTDEIKNLPMIDNNELVEKYVENCQKQEIYINGQHKLSEHEMNTLFDKLLDDNKIESNYDVVSDRSVDSRLSKASKGKKRRAIFEDASDEEFNIKVSSKCKRGNTMDSINMEQELKECIGVASRKSQRSCTSGKQKVLTEYWSSDESNLTEPVEALPVQDNIVHDLPLLLPSQSILPRFRSQSPLSIPPLSPLLPLTSPSPVPLPEPSPSQEPASPSSSQVQTLENSIGEPKLEVAAVRQKRATVDTLYYWSSSSDDEDQGMIEVKPLREEEYCDEDDRPLQHGWIVGNSPKKLVTMLAQAKGKKVIDSHCVKKGKKKRTSL